LRSDVKAEGFVLKNMDSAYTFMKDKANRSKDWIKFKPEHTGCFLTLMDILHYSTPKDIDEMRRKREIGLRHAVATLPSQEGYTEMGLFPSGRHGEITKQHEQNLRVIEAENLGKNETVRFWVTFDVRYPYYATRPTTLLFPRLVSPGDEADNERETISFEAFKLFLTNRANVVNAVLDANVNIMNAEEPAIDALARPPTP
jgi:hypothetical protein